MPVTAVEALAPPPQPKPERVEPARDDRDFARELEDAASREEELRREPAGEEKADGASQAAQVATAPAPISAGPPKTEAARVPLAGMGAEPTPDAGAALAPVAATPASENHPAQPFAQASEQPTTSAPESLAAGAKPPLAAEAKPSAAGAAAAATPPAAAAAAQTNAAADEAGREGKSEIGKWTASEAARPAATVAAMGAAPNAQAQAVVGAGERLPAVKVLRQIDASSSAESKPAPPTLAAAISHNSAAHAGAAPSFDAQPASLDSSAATAGSGSATTARPAAAPPPAAQIAVHVAQAVEDGVRRLEVRLTPAELGRVEVKLDVGHDGRVLAVVSADRQDTLDLLQRDARGLERALQDAGIRADGGSLSFTLRQQEREAWGQTDGGPAGAEPPERESDPALELAAAQRRTGLRALDISV